METHMTNKVTSMTKVAMPWGTIQDEPKQATATVDIVIPAFNEGNCIEALLNDVVKAKKDDWFEIEHIYVISDASTDQTDEIVQQVADRDQRVRLIRKQERKGVQDSKNIAFAVTNADILVFIDADVRLASEHSIPKLVQYFRDGKAALVQGGLVRPCCGLSLNPAKQAGYFDWILVDRIRRQKDMSWWSIDGRVMALSRGFYHHLSLPCSLADDQFIFYSCIEQRRKFVWADDAIFYYGPPESIADFVHQWSRYFFYTNKSQQYFGEDLIKKNMNVPGLWRTIMSSIMRHPLCGLMWLLCYGISKIEFMHRVNFEEYEHGFFWTVSKPLTIKDEGRLRDESALG